MTSATRRRRGARADRAADTRRRIVEAATALFVELGYLDTTMAGIARAAGVAVQTLYLSFGSKAAVLEAAVAGTSQDQPSGWIAQSPTEGPDDPSTDRWARLRAEPDGRVAVGRHVASTAAAVARAHPLTAVLWAAAADPEPAELLARVRSAALADHARAVDELAEKPGFTDRISLQRATEVLAALLSPETYGLLVAEQAWTVLDWTEWATRHAAADLFPSDRSDPGDGLPPRHP